VLLLLLVVLLKLGSPAVLRLARVQRLLAPLPLPLLLLVLRQHRLLAVLLLLLL
jgi:hypothetical protein